MHPAPPVGFAGPGQRAVAIHGDEGIELLALIYGVQGLGSETFAGHYAFSHQLLYPGNGRLEHCGRNRKLRTKENQRWQEQNAPYEVPLHDAPKLSSRGGKRNHQD